MYKFPEKFDAGVFVGRALEMICFNANQIYFHFDRTASLCVETQFTIERPPNIVSVVMVPALSSDLMLLLERKVVSARVHDGETLIVEFDNSWTLRFAALPEFESYRVTIGTETIVI
jgi:hypothetical protein